MIAFGIFYDDHMFMLLGDSSCGNSRTGFLLFIQLRSKGFTIVVHDLRVTSGTIRFRAIQVPYEYRTQLLHYMAASCFQGLHFAPGTDFKCSLIRNLKHTSMDS